MSINYLPSGSTVRCILWGNAVDHLYKAQTGAWNHRLVHLLTGLVELIPIIGQIVVFAEIFFKRETRSFPEEGPSPPQVSSVGGGAPPSATDLSAKKRCEDLMEEVGRYCRKEGAGKERRALAALSLYSDRSEDLDLIRAIVLGRRRGSSLGEERALGSLYGNVVGDACGAPFEFLAYSRDPISETLSYVLGGGNFSLRRGQWTDDASMALCLADALHWAPQKEHLNGLLCRITYTAWWQYGYNTAFAHDPTKGGAVGLGGNISASMSGSLDWTAITGDGKGLLFPDERYETRAGNRYTSGNGAAMRNGPVALAARDLNHAMRLAWQQSRVTHQGYESALCCMVMAWISYTAIHSSIEDPLELKAYLFEELQKFRIPGEEIPPEVRGDPVLEAAIRAVEGLAHSQEGVPNCQSPARLENWNWRDPNFLVRCCAENPRKLAQAGYFGSYVMDGLAIAFHCIFTTSSFGDAMLRATRHGGDADSIGAIAGSMLGAIYGLPGIPGVWLREVCRHEPSACPEKGNVGGDIGIRALLLYRAADAARRTTSATLGLCGGAGVGAGGPAAASS